MVAQIQDALKSSSSLEELFAQYVKEYFAHQLTFYDEQQIEQRIEKEWVANVQRIKSNFNTYLDAKEGRGAQGNFKNHSKLDAICRLTQEQAACSNISELETLVNKTKNSAINLTRLKIQESYIFEKIREQYYEVSKDRWNSVIIAKILEKMGILTSSSIANK